MILSQALDRARELRASPENPSTPLSAPAQWMLDAFGAGRTRAGAQISEESAHTISAFYCGVRVLTDGLAQTPLILYRRRSDGGKDRATEHPLYPVLHDRTNDLMSAFTFRETMQGHAVVWGNAYAEIEQAGDGSVKALWPLLPDRTQAGIVNGRKVVRTILSNGQQVTLPGSRVLHIPGFGFDGITGRSLIHLARESLGLTKATEEFGAGFFGSGTKMAGVLSHPGTLTKKAKENLRESWTDMHSGLDNAHRIAILEEGLKWTQIGVPPEDAQFLQTRQHQVTEVARWLRVQPHKIMDLQRATFSNIEQQNIEHLQDTMLPWFVKWEQEISWALLTPKERQTFVAAFLLAGFLRGDSAARGSFYTQLFQIGSMSPNEILAAEDRNPVEGGDQRFVPLNMIPLSMAASEPVDDDDDRSRAKNQERRAKIVEVRQVATRKRQRDTFRPLLQEQAQRTLNRELIKLRRLVTKVFGSGGTVREFTAQLDSFYDDYPATVARDFTGVFTTFAKQILDTIVLERDADERLVDLDKFVNDFVASFSRKWTARSRKQLQASVREAEKGAEREAAEARLEEWERSRAVRVARDEAVKGGEAFSRFTYASLGVILFRWVTVGLNCPMCDSLEGKIVGSREVFAKTGDQISGGDGQSISVNSNVLHPPLHDGCDCLVIPGG